MRGRDGTASDISRTRCICFSARCGTLLRAFSDLPHTGDSANNVFGLVVVALGTFSRPLDEDVEVIVVLLQKTAVSLPDEWQRDVPSAQKGPLAALRSR